MFFSFLFKTFCLTIKKFREFGILALESVYLTLEIGLYGFHFFIFSLKIKVTELKIFFEFNCLIPVFIDLSLKFCLGPNYFCFKSLTNLSFFFCQSFKFIVSAVNDVLEFIDFTVEKIKLVGMSIFEKRKL